MTTNTPHYNYRVVRYPNPSGEGHLLLIHEAYYASSEDMTLPLSLNPDPFLATAEDEDELLWLLESLLDDVQNVIAGVAPILDAESYNLSLTPATSEAPVSTLN